MEGSTLIKIGQAKSLKRRLAAMQMGLPFKLELLYMLEVEEPKTRTLGKAAKDQPPETYKPGSTDTMATIPAFATVAETGEAPPMATAHVLDFLQRYPTVAQTPPGGARPAAHGVRS